MSLNSFLIAKDKMPLDAAIHWFAVNTYIKDSQRLVESITRTKRHEYYSQWNKIDIIEGTLNVTDITNCIKNLLDLDNKSMRLGGLSIEFIHCLSTLSMPNCQRVVIEFLRTPSIMESILMITFKPSSVYTTCINLLRSVVQYDKDNNTSISSNVSRYGCIIDVLRASIDELPLEIDYVNFISFFFFILEIFEVETPVTPADLSPLHSILCDLPALLAKVVIDYKANYLITKVCAIFDRILSCVTHTLATAAADDKDATVFCSALIEVTSKLLNHLSLKHNTHSKMYVSSNLHRHFLSLCMDEKLVKAISQDATTQVLSLLYEMCQEPEVNECIKTQLSPTSLLNNVLYKMNQSHSVSSESCLMFKVAVSLVDLLFFRHHIRRIEQEYWFSGRPTGSGSTEYLQCIPLIIETCFKICTQQHQLEVSIGSEEGGAEAALAKADVPLFDYKLYVATNIGLAPVVPPVLYALSALWRLSASINITDYLNENSGTADVDRVTLLLNETIHVMKETIKSNDGPLSIPDIILFDAMTIVCTHRDLLANVSPTSTFRGYFHDDRSEQTMVVKVNFNSTAWFSAEKDDETGLSIFALHENDPNPFPAPVNGLYKEYCEGLRLIGLRIYNKTKDIITQKPLSEWHKLPKKHLCRNIILISCICKTAGISIIESLFFDVKALFLTLLQVLTDDTLNISNHPNVFQRGLQIVDGMVRHFNGEDAAKDKVSADSETSGMLLTLYNKIRDILCLDNDKQSTRYSSSDVGYTMYIQNDMFISSCISMLILLAHEDKIIARKIVYDYDALVTGILKYDRNITILPLLRLTAEICPVLNKLDSRNDELVFMLMYTSLHLGLTLGFGSAHSDRLEYNSNYGLEVAIQTMLVIIELDLASSFGLIHKVLMRPEIEHMLKRYIMKFCSYNRDNNRVNLRLVSLLIRCCLVLTKDVNPRPMWIYTSYSLHFTNYIGPDLSYRPLLDPKTLDVVMRMSLYHASYNLDSLAQSRHDIHLLATLLRYGTHLLYNCCDGNIGNIPLTQGGGSSTNGYNSSGVNHVGILKNKLINIFVPIISSTLSMVTLIEKNREKYNAHRQALASQSSSGTTRIASRRPKQFVGQAYEELVESVTDATYAFFCYDDVFPMATYLANQHRFKKRPVCMCVVICMKTLRENVLVQRRGLEILKMFIQNKIDVRLIGVISPQVLSNAVKKCTEFNESSASFAKIISLLAPLVPEDEVVNDNLLMFALHLTLASIVRTCDGEPVYCSVKAIADLSCRSEKLCNLMCSSGDVVEAILHIMSKKPNDVRIVCESIRALIQLSKSNNCNQLLKYSFHAENTIREGKKFLQGVQRDESIKGPWDTVTKEYLSAVCEDSKSLLNSNEKCVVS